MMWFLVKHIQCWEEKVEGEELLSLRIGQMQEGEEGEEEKGQLCHEKNLKVGHQGERGARYENPLLR